MIEEMHGGCDDRCIFITEGVSCLFLEDEFNKSFILCANEVEIHGKGPENKVGSGNVTDKVEEFIFVILDLFYIVRYIDETVFMLREVFGDKMRILYRNTCISLGTAVEDNNVYVISLLPPMRL